MGNVSRDARLTFIQLWTIADDEGRLRGNSRMLASLLFPYDDDAPALIDGWLKELETEGCIVRYKSGAQSYVQLCNWLTHQKIDKPSKSKIPPFDESSREVAKPREVSSEEGIKDQGEEGKGSKELVERRDASPDRDAPEKIFAYWQKTMDSPRAVFDDKRRKLIVTALKTYEPRQLCEAIKGCERSDFHMARGKYAGNNKQNGLGLILRDAEHIDKFIEMASQRTSGAESIEQRNARILADLMAGDGASDPDVIDVDMSEVDHA